MTLDMELEVPDYDATLKYHSDRSPDEAKVKKLCESLDLAREIVEDAESKLSYALTDPGLHPTLQTQRQDARIPDIEIAKEAARYHFKLDDVSSSETRKEVRDKILQIIAKTDEGLSKATTLSDSLNYYTWNDYSEGDPRVAQHGKSRVGTETAKKRAM